MGRYLPWYAGFGDPCQSFSRGHESLKGLSKVIYLSFLCLYPQAYSHCCSIGVLPRGLQTLHLCCFYLCPNDQDFTYLARWRFGLDSYYWVTRRYEVPPLPPHCSQCCAFWRVNDLGFSCPSLMKQQLGLSFQAPSHWTRATYFADWYYYLTVGHFGSHCSSREPCLSLDYSRSAHLTFTAASFSCLNFAIWLSNAAMGFLNSQLRWILVRFHRCRYLAQMSWVLSFPCAAIIRISPL